MKIPIVILAVVFLLIAIRQIGNFRLQIWQIMLGGALAVLVFGQISPQSALRAINLEVMLFLFGMFVVGEALEQSGYLAHLSYKIFKKAKTIDQLLLLVLLVMGIASAFLMNDTLAIIGTPVVLLLARHHKISPKVLLLALAFAVTIGSVMSPIGNPQNLLIAIYGNIKNPFITFLKYLFIPTMINLLLAFLLLKQFYKNGFHNSILNHSQEPIKDHKLAFLSKISLGLIVVLVFAKILTVFLNLKYEFRLTYIALGAGLPILIFSERRVKILKSLDWQTLIFFASMFVLMQSVWDTGFFQQFLNGFKLTSLPMILLVSTVLSQFISNVPMVALYLPLLEHLQAGTKEFIALSVGSTIAGNMLILGAASNVIIIQNAEKKDQTLSFFEFAKIGIPLTVLNLLIYWLVLII